jgi:hypothetical protein
MTDLNEIHELPLANRLVDAAIREWLDRKLDLQFAQYADGSPEWKALDQARHVALGGYTYDLTPKVLDALRRAGVVPGIESPKEGE